MMGVSTFAAFVGRALARRFWLIPADSMSISERKPAAVVGRGMARRFWPFPSADFIHPAEIAPEKSPKGAQGNSPGRSPGSDHTNKMSPEGVKQRCRLRDSRIRSDKTATRHSNPTAPTVRASGPIASPASAGRRTMLASGARIVRSANVLCALAGGRKAVGAKRRVRVGRSYGALRGITATLSHPSGGGGRSDFLVGSQTISIGSGFVWMLQATLLSLAIAVVGLPVAAQPAAAQPAAAKVIAAQPGNAKSVAAKPVAAQPGSAKSVAKKPGSTQPGSMAASDGRPASIDHAKAQAEALEAKRNAHRAEQKALAEREEKRRAAIEALSEPWLNNLLTGADASGEAMASAELRTDKAQIPETLSRFAGLEDALASAERAVAALKRSAPGDATLASDALINSIRRIEAEQMLVLDRFALWIEKRGEANRPWLRFGDQSLNRLTQAQSTLRQAFAKRSTALKTIRANLAQVTKDNGEALSAALAQWPVRAANASVVDTYGLDLPVSRPRFAPLPVPNGPFITPSYANSASEVMPEAADFASHPGAEIDKAILDKAAELGNEYHRIYDFVRSDIETDWYAGSLRGATGTLRSGRGNDVDQALLLAALLRASSAPARIVRGVIDVPVNLLSQQLAVPVTRIGASLTAAGIAHEPLTVGGSIGAYRIEHTWVSAYVPIDNYRGTSVSDGGKTWVPLSTALKPYQWRAAGNVFELANITPASFIDAWLTRPTGTASPWEHLRSELETRLSTLAPAQRLEDVAALHQRATPKLNVLPMTLVGQNAQAISETAHLPDIAFQRVMLNIKRDTDTVMSLNRRAYEWVGQRLTLGFAPATEDDTLIANGYGGLGQTPPFLVQTRFKLARNGEPVRYSEATFTPGTQLNVELTLSSPAGERRYNQNLKAGGYAALVIAHHGAVTPQPEPDVQQAGDSEYAAARLMWNLGAHYITRWNQSDQAIGNAIGISRIAPLPTALLVINQQQLTETDGLPTSLDWKGVALDVGIRPSEPIGTNATRERDFLRLSALEGSALERLVFERQWSVDSISAEKGLALAHAAGTQIRRLQPGDDLSSLNLPPTIRAQLQAQLNAGYHLTTPASQITREAWQGNVWRAEDPESGASGWFIAGTYAGGATALPPERWFFRDLRDLLFNPYANPPNNDPLSLAYIVPSLASQEIEGEPNQQIQDAIDVFAFDVEGRPVVGAFMTIRAQGNSAETVGSNTSTNGQGRLRQTIRFKETGGDGDFGVYDSSEPYPQFKWLTFFEISAPSSRGTIRSGRNARSKLRPGPPHSIRLIRPDTRLDGFEYPESGNSPYFTALPGFPSLLVFFDIVDAFENRIANEVVNISLSTLFQSTDCADAPPRHAPRIVDKGNCSSSSVRSDDACAIPTNTVISRSSPAQQALHVAMPEWAFASRVRLSSGGLEEAFLASTAPFAKTPLTVDSEPQSPRGCDTPFSSFFYSERADPRESVLVGETARTPRQYSMYKVKWDLDPLFRRRFNGWEPETGLFFQVNGTGYLSGGTGEYTLTSTGGPGIGDLDLAFYLIRDGTFYARFNSPQPFVALRLDDPEYLPDPIRLTAFANLTSPIRVDVDITGGERGFGAPFEIEMLAGNESIGKFETSNAIFPFRGVLDTTARINASVPHYFRYRVNAGDQNYEYTSERFPIRISQDIVAGYGIVAEEGVDALALVNGAFPKELKISSKMNLAAQTSCAAGDFFAYFLQRSARLTFQIFALNSDGSRGGELTWRPLNNEPRSAGSHVFPIPPERIPFGTYEFQITAESDGQSEEYTGLIEHLVQRTDSLSVGHSMVQNVNVFYGSAVLADADIAVAGRGPGMSLRRTYSSDVGDELGSFGIGWRSNLESRIEFGECGAAYVIGADGHGHAFQNPVSQSDGSIRWSPERGYHGSLVQRGLAFDFYSVDGTRYHFAEQDLKGTRLSFVEDAYGNRVTYDYTNRPSGRVVSRMTDGVGRSISLEYQTRSFQSIRAGNLVRTSADVVTRADGPLNWRIDYTYDITGALRLVERGAGAARLARFFAYVDLGGQVYQEPSGVYRYIHFGQRLRTVRNAINGAETTYTYIPGLTAIQSDISAPPIYIPTRQIGSVTRTDGGTWEFEYTGVRGLGPVSTVATDPRNNDTEFDMDRYGLVLETIDPAGTSTTQWNLDHLKPALETDRNGTRTISTYDSNGNLIRSRIEHASGNIEREARFREPASFTAWPWIKNRPEYEIDFVGRRTDFQYNSRGSLTSRTLAGITETRSYAANGDLASSADGTNAITTFTYDNAGYPRIVTDPLGFRTTYTHDERGRQTSMTDALQRVTTMTYDALDRRIETVLPSAGAPARIRTVYVDALDQREEFDELGGSTFHKFDKLGRLVRRVAPTTEAQAAVERFEYDANGNQTRALDQLDGETLSTYDASNRRITQVEPLGRKTTWTYDAQGNVIREVVSQTDGDNARTTETTYAHPLYKPTQVRRALLGESGPPTWLTTDTEYNANGEVLAIVDPRRARTIIVRDGRGREVLRTEPLGKTTATAYDDADRKVEETRANAGGSGVQLRKWTYDAVGRELSFQDATGAIRSKSYDPVGNLLTETDARNNITSMRYDVRNRLIERRSAVGQVTTFGYDAVGNLTTQSNPGGRTVTHVYDARNRRIESRDQLGLIGRYQYDSKSRQVSSVNTVGRIEREFDALDRLLQETTTGFGPVARTTFTYTIHDEIATRRDGRDRVTSFEYDSVGRKIKQTAPAPLSYVEQWAYDANGNEIGYTNGRNHTWAYTVDALNRRTAITAPDVGSGNRTEIYTFDAEGNRLSTTDRLGIVETYTFDAENRQLTRTRDGELKFTRVFDAQGNLTSETDARGNATTHTFDAANRRTQTTRPEGVIEVFTYTADNDIATIKDGLNRITTHTFDVRRRRESTTNPANETTRWTYDLADRQISMRLPLNNVGQEWRYAYDAAGRLLRVTSPQAAVTEYRYDLAGNRVQETTARGQGTLMEYDSLNRLISRTVTSSSWQWIHDAAGNVVEVRTPNGAVIAHTFDARNRKTESALQSSPTSGHWRRTTWSYDANDKVTRETITRHDSTPDYVTERGYDRQERLTREANGHGQVLVSTFDRNGNRTSLIDAQGETTSYQYDALNRLKQSSAPGIGTTTYHYDTASQLIRKEGQGSYQAAYAHDGAGRIDTIAHRIGSTPLLELDYEFDDNGNRTQQVLRSGAETETTNYTFDDSDRLTAFEIGDTRTSYTLDAVGNRTLEQVRVAGAITRETAYTFDARDQVTTETPAVPTGPPIAYTHDANGNLTRRGPAASPLATYLYDSRDRLIRLTTGAQAPIESHYDEQDRRISRSDGATGSRYQWLGNHLIEEFNSTNNRLTRYHRGVGLIGTTGQTSSPEPRQYALDALGTPLALIRTDGAIAGRTKFDPWGLVTSQSGEQSKLGHGNYQREPDNHYQAIARWYRPGLGRFMSMDPINGDPMQPGTLNEYLAMLGSPTQFLDPDGRQSIGIGVRSCSDTGACAATQMAASALPLLNPSQMATSQQADALIEAQARMALFSPGRPDSAMVAQPLLASGAGRFERPYVANSTARQLSAMQSSADLDQALGLDPNYVAYGQGTEAAGAAAVSSIPPFAVIGGVQTMAAAENPWEFAFGATEALLGAVPMAMAARAEVVAFRAERVAMGNRLRAQAEGTKPIELAEAPNGTTGVRFNEVDAGAGKIEHPLRSDGASRALPVAADEAATTTQITYVIGRTDDLLKPGVVRAGERPFEFEVVRHSDGRTNKRPTWYNNYRALRIAARENRPIRDVSPGNELGEFLNGERMQFKHRGWKETQDGQDVWWVPPKG